jgi:hypothetical protein
MGPTTELRREIKRCFVPLMISKGFALDLRNAPQFVAFRKMTPDAIRVCDIQWEKRGRPRFVINFGKCGRAGVNFHGRRVAPEDVMPSCMPVLGRLAPGRHSTVGGWFRQDRSLIGAIVHRSSLRPPAEVVAELLALFHEVEDWWATGSVGAHLRMTPSRGSRDAVEN